MKLIWYVKVCRFSMHSSTFLTPSERHNRFSVMSKSNIIQRKNIQFWPDSKFRVITTVIVVIYDRITVFMVCPFLFSCAALSEVHDSLSLYLIPLSSYHLSSYPWGECDNRGLNTKTPLAVISCLRKRFFQDFKDQKIIF